MVATDQLRQIASLVEALIPLGKKQRGMRIEAEEWNRLVTTLLAVLEIDRVQEATTRLLLIEQFAPKQHEHLGEVEVSWLGANMQERLGEGAAGSLSTRTALSDVGKRVDASSAEMARLTAIVERQQERNDRASVDELERGVKLREFEARFSGLENLRAMVSGLAKNVTDLAPAIQAVLDLRGELRDDNGDPIDVQAMAAQLALVRTLAEHLNGIDGTPVRMRDVELRLRELTDALGLPGGIGLEGRIAQHATQLEASLNEQFEGLSGDLKSEQQAALNDLSINQDAVLNDLRANQDAALTATLNDLRANQDATLNDLSINQEAVLNDLRDNQHAALDQLRFEIDARFAESAGRLQEEMKAALLSEVGDLRQQMEKQAQQLRELDERLRRLEG